MQQTQNEPKIPVGTEFLNLIGEHERSTEANFEEWLLTAGVKPRKLSNRWEPHFLVSTVLLHACGVAMVGITSRNAS